MKKPKRKPRKLLLKFRFVPHVRMPRSVAWRLLKEAVMTGVMPPEMDIAYMDYAHKTGRVLKAGQQLSREELEEFRNLLGIMVGAEHQGSIRLEKVG
jgi:hypothetical protein